jgi:rubredoxin-NAD+ reductase
MVKYECLICNYIYDEEEGDLENGILEDTTWKELPRNWCCPTCGIAKSDMSSWEILENDNNESDEELDKDDEDE